MFARADIGRWSKAGGSSGKENAHSCSSQHSLESALALSYAADQRQKAKQRLNLTLRKKWHLPSLQEVGHPSLNPPQTQDGEEANRESDKASSRVEKRFDGELEIAMDAEEKLFNTVAEEPTGFYF